MRGSCCSAAPPAACCCGAWGAASGAVTSPCCPWPIKPVPGSGTVPVASGAAASFVAGAGGAAGGAAGAISQDQQGTMADDSLSTLHTDPATHTNTCLAAYRPCHRRPEHAAKPGLVPAGSPASSEATPHAPQRACMRQFSKVCGLMLLRADRKQAGRASSEDRATATETGTFIPAPAAAAACASSFGDWRDQHYSVHVRRLTAML